VIGAATIIDITPESPLQLACKETICVEEPIIGSRLEANVLLLSDNNSKAVLISLDWFFCSPMLREKILRKCSDLLESAELIVTASHTHSSPNTDFTKSSMGKVDSSYVNRVETLVADRVHEILLMQTYRPVKICYSTDFTNCAINRRSLVWWPTRKGLMKISQIHPNPNGPCDRELRLLQVRGLDDSLIAIIWGISCHPTDWPNIKQVSADYPGEVRSEIRSHVHNSVPILFLQGFAGNLRPRCVGIWPKRGRICDRASKLLLAVLNGSSFVGFNPAGYNKWVQEIVQSVKRALDNRSHTTIVSGGLQGRRKTVPTSALGITSDVKEISFQTIELGGQLVLAAISAEATWEHAENLKFRFPSKHIWPIGYADHTFGYLPTRDMLEEGGYECVGFMEHFGVSGTFVSMIDEIVIEAFTKLIFPNKDGVE
jgi:neutral ceramidase